MTLRSTITTQRADRNTVWQDLEFYKLAVRTREKRTIVLQNQLNTMTLQKRELSEYSQRLLDQLASEKQKTQRLTLRIRKYSKNVKSLHKRTSSLSGLTRYQTAPFQQEPDAPQRSRTVPQEKVPAALDLKQDESCHDVVNSKVEGDAVSPATPSSSSNIDLQKKRQELQQLEAQTLEILNQLQEETKMLVGETKKSKHKRRRRGGTAAGGGGGGNAAASTQRVPGRRSKVM